MTITITLLILILLIVFFVPILILFFFSKQNKGSSKNLLNTQFHLTFLKEQEFNPDISTDNWDLHKLRLKKFRRSQYKGLTFFVSSENKIYYLSEKGDKVYC